MCYYLGIIYLCTCEKIDIDRIFTAISCVHRLGVIYLCTCEKMILVVHSVLFQVFIKGVIMGGL
jgi:hypothetical protein